MSKESHYSSINSEENLDHLTALTPNDRPRKQSCFVKPLWILYVILTVIVASFAVIRIFAFSMRSGWRSDLGSSFPDACGSWAIDSGCTRISLYENSCTRPESITTENAIVLKSNNDQLINGIIARCIDDLSGAKLMSPDNFADSFINGKTIHVTVNSFFFGFLDDLYIMSTDGGSVVERYLTMQSQLRLGSSDFDQNY